MIRLQEEKSMLAYCLEEVKDVPCRTLWEALNTTEKFAAAQQCEPLQSNSCLNHIGSNNSLEHY